MSRTKSYFYDYVEITKPGLVFFVTCTVALSYCMATGGQIDFIELFLLLSGTYLAGSGAHVFNQTMERKNDARMERTRRRPISQGKIRPLPAYAFATGLSATGVGTLYFGNNTATALVCLLTLLLYLLAYTPLKQVTVWNTWIGALPGALPALMGWTAKWNALPAESWTLFLIVFFWQIPHFLSLAWRYRKDYAKGGFKMLPGFDEKGKITAWQNLIHVLLLAEISLLPFFLDQAGALYLSIALALGTGFVFFSVRFFFNPDLYAKKMFLYSIIYLPLLYSGFAWEHLGFGTLGQKLASF